MHQPAMFVAVKPRSLGPNPWIRYDPMDSNGSNGSNDSNGNCSISNCSIHRSPSPGSWRRSHSDGHSVAGSAASCGETNAHRMRKLSEAVQNLFLAFDSLRLLVCYMLIRRPAGVFCFLLCDTSCDSFSFTYNWSFDRFLLCVAIRFFVFAALPPFPPSPLHPPLHVYTIVQYSLV